MKRQTIVSTMLSMVAVFASVPAASAETALTATQLHEQCLRYFEEPRSAAGIACASYIRGFLDGAAAVEGAPRHTTASGQAVEPTSSPPHQVVRGEHRSYCTDNSVTIDRVVAEVLKYAGEYPPLSRTTAGELLDAVLRRFHACH